jgi:hypothetical protein
MPRLSEFRGIVISMYYKDHGVPHFHAVYAGEDVSIAIDTLEVLEGSAPKRIVRLAREWAELHRDELSANWQRARRKDELKEIDPLP